MVVARVAFQLGLLLASRPAASDLLVWVPRDGWLPVRALNRVEGAAQVESSAGR